MIHPVSIFPSVCSCPPLPLWYPPCLHHFLPPASLPHSLTSHQRCTERESQFKRCLTTMLTEQCGDDQHVLIIKEVCWRSDKVTIFSLFDRAHDARKSEQACWQTKRRVHKGVISNRPAPSGFQAWAVHK